MIGQKDLKQKGHWYHLYRLDAAFDKVQRKRLSKKERVPGIRGILYHWNKNFLTDRYQQVVVKMCIKWITFYTENLYRMEYPREVYRVVHKSQVAPIYYMVLSE